MKTKIFCHGLLKNNNDEVLYLKRSNSKIYGGLWDLPGGKLEEHENYYSCLVREFKEETNLDIEVGQIIDVKSQIYDNCIIIVLIFSVNAVNELTITLNNEHDEYTFAKSIDKDTLIWYL